MIETEWARDEGFLATTGEELNHLDTPSPVIIDLRCTELYYVFATQVCYIAAVLPETLETPTFLTPEKIAKLKRAVTMKLIDFLCNVEASYKTSKGLDTWQVSWRQQGHLEPANRYMTAECEWKSLNGNLSFRPCFQATLLISHWLTEKLFPSDVDSMLNFADLPEKLTTMERLLSEAWNKGFEGPMGPKGTKGNLKGMNLATCLKNAILM
jgi:hypothetical protein